MSPITLITDGYWETLKSSFFPIKNVLMGIERLVERTRVEVRISLTALLTPAPFCRPSSLLLILRGLERFDRRMPRPRQ
jgi:hypothetical protein